MEWPDIRCDEDMDTQGAEHLRFSIPVSFSGLTMRGIFLPANRLPSKVHRSDESEDPDEPELMLTVACEMGDEFGRESVIKLSGVRDRTGKWVLRKPSDQPMGRRLTDLFYKMAGEEAGRIRARIEEAFEMIRDSTRVPFRESPVEKSDVRVAHTAMPEAVEETREGTLFPNAVPDKEPKTNQQIDVPYGQNPKKHRKKKPSQDGQGRLFD